MLDGQGADEQLAGYHDGFPYYYRGLIRRFRFAMLLRALLERRRWHGRSIVAEAATILLPLLPNGLMRRLRRQRQALLHHDWLDGELLRPHLRQTARDTARHSLGVPPVAGLGDLCRLMTQSSNLAMLLHWEDRNSMAHGIEARVPFLDHRLVELSIGLGDDHKMVGGDTKRVLRRAMTGILPEPVRNRRDKLGFATPEESWLRGPLREAVLGGIEQTLSVFPGLFNGRGVRAHAAAMLDGKRGVDFSLWRIVNFGIWGRLFGVGA
jgi:asparagine synthase (glutamine-hydrolysing)